MLCSSTDRAKSTLCDTRQFQWRHRVAPKSQVLMSHTTWVMGSSCSQWHAGIAEERQSCLLLLLFGLFSCCFGSNNTKTRGWSHYYSTALLMKPRMVLLFVVVLPLLLSTALLLELSPSQIHRVHRVFVCVEACCSSSCVRVCICVWF